MELGYVVAAAKRFWWVVIIGVMVGTGLGYVVPLSEASTR